MSHRCVRFFELSAAIRRLLLAMDSFLRDRTVYMSSHWQKWPRSGVNPRRRIKANGRNHMFAAQCRALYDFVVCAPGPSGSMCVAARVAQKPDATVLLPEAGGRRLVTPRSQTLLWPKSWSSERTGRFTAEPAPLPRPLRPGRWRWPRCSAMLEHHRARPGQVT